MSEREPAAEPSFASDGPDLTSWEAARDRLRQAGTYWLSTVRPDGRPHAVPLLALWMDGLIYFSSSHQSVKAANLVRNPNCVLTAGGAELDLSVEGSAEPITDDVILNRVIRSYLGKYGWQATLVSGIGLDADGIGEPPYLVFRVTPAKVIALAKGPGFSATRFRFG